MSKQSLLTFIASLVVLSVTAQLPSDSTQQIGSNNPLVPASFDVISLMNPWLSTTNPAGLRFNPGLDIGDLSINYRAEHGDYRQALKGDSLQEYYFSTSSFRHVRNSVVFGSFTYNKSFEHNCNYSLVNDPYRRTPYLLLDTAFKNDIYDREFFNLRGDLSTPFLENFSYGLSVSMDVGLAAQDRDPRAQNKVLNLDVSQGLLFNTGGFTIGLNALYSYYNEDIEVDIIEKFAQYDFFQLVGFDLHILPRDAESFYRLYERNTYGGEAQMGIQSGGLNSVFGGKFLYYNESAIDGRRGGDATWSTKKADSWLEGNIINLFNLTTYSHGMIRHQLKANYDLQYQVGSEYKITLVKEDVTDAQNWVIFALEEKYAARYTSLDFNYTFMLLKAQYLPGLKVDLNLAYDGRDQDYYLPDMVEVIRNRTMGVSAEKTFYTGKHAIALGAGLHSRKNLSAIQDLEAVTYSTDILNYPDFIYYTGDASDWWVHASWSVGVKKLVDRYYADFYLGSVRFEDGRDRNTMKISTGVIF